MKHSKFVILLSIFVVGFGYLFFSGYASLHPQSDNLPEYMIGRWVSEVSSRSSEDVSSPYYQLEFQKSGRLILSRTGEEKPLYNLVFQYEMTEDGQIAIDGRMAGVLHVSREGDDLLIQSDVFEDMDGRYAQKPTIAWGLVAGLLALGIYAVGSIRFRELLKAIRANASGFTRQPWSGKAIFIGLVLVGGIVFYLGWKISAPLWRHPALTTIRLPWDAVISIELSLLLILLIFRFVNRLLIKFGSNHCLSGKIAILASVLGLGMSLEGLFLGLVRLVVWVSVGSYPQ